MNNNGFALYQQSISISNQIEKMKMFSITKSALYICSFIVLIQIY
jgi:hypothetical protein